MSKVIDRLLILMEDDSPSATAMLEKRQLQDIQHRIKDLEADLFKLYSGINHVMCVMGADGEVSTRDNVATEMMDILYDIDQGRFIEKKVDFLANLNTEGE